MSGGLGTACYGLTKAMSRLGTEITFVLPKAAQVSESGHIRMLAAEGYFEPGEFKNVRFRTITSPLMVYGSCGTPQGCGHKKGASAWHNELSEDMVVYGRDIFEQVHRYANKAAEIASVEDFNLVHAHDWMTYPAGMAAARISQKPLVIHVHSTEFDRSGDNVNQMIYDIERAGMHAAQKVVTVSNYTKNIITSRYDVPPEKVEVVYNGVDRNGCSSAGDSIIDKSDKIVLFLGRITMQKGPEYFITAAKKVLEKISNVKFIMAGDGDMTHRMIEYAAWLGIGHKVFFTRFLRGSDVDKAYRMADLFVMPSVSEPFGIAPLEALQRGVPVLISKQSGISEVLTHALRVDFWDINQMADKMAAVLRHAPLSRMLRDNGSAEAAKFCWEDSARSINRIYSQLTACA